MTLLRIHARLDDLQGHLAADRLLLLGHVDHAHAAFADLLQELVGADQGAGLFGDELVDGRSSSRGRFFQKVARLGICLQQPLDAIPQLNVVSTGSAKVRVTFGFGPRLQSLKEDLVDSRSLIDHSVSPRMTVT